MNLLTLVDLIKLKNMTKSELKFYIGILEDLNGKKAYNNYEKLRNDLLIEFGIKTTIENIKNALYELLEQPTLEEEINDLAMIYSHTC